MVKQLKVETPGGIYTVNVPTERMGAKHLAIVTKTIAASNSIAKAGGIVSEANAEKISKSFEDWSAAVLPKIIVDGPCEYKDMPGEDQYSLFMAMVHNVKFNNGQLFRIVE
jgi:hypothetical protein